METKTLVNLNTAEESELAQVPGIGPALAGRIVAARPFASFDDVRRVPGIGSSTLDKIAPHITVEEVPFAEAEAPAIEVAPEGLGFVDIAPFEDKEEQGVAEVPADLVPLPPLPVVPPWNEDEAEALVSESAPEALPATEEAQAVVPPPLPETPSPLPEAPPEATVKAQPPASHAKPKPEAPKTPSPAATPPKPVTRAQLAWVSFFVFAVTLLIALALSLGILTGLNGGLYFASPDDVARVSRQVSALQGEVDTLDQSLNSVQTRLDNLEALSGRIEALEMAKDDLLIEVEGLTSQAKALDTRLQAVAQETTTLNTQMERVRAQSERVQQVMDGLRDLLNSLFPQE